jgi:acetyl esterase/lipase
MTSSDEPWVDPEVDRPGTRGLSIENLAAVRAAADAELLDDNALRHGGSLDFEEFEIPSAFGAPNVPALLLKSGGGIGPLPCLYYVSIGGMIYSSTRYALDAFGILGWLAELEAVGLVVAPRVGPEDPYPAQVEDAYSGLAWLASHSEKLGVDANRILLVGVSAGGGVAAATALMARDRGGPALTHQVLITPMLDDRSMTPSSRFEDVTHPRASNEFGWRAILGDRSGGLDVSPYAAPARAAELSGLPPTYLEAGSADTFRDEVIDYGARLAAAGVPLELHVWAGGMHGFDLHAPKAEVSKAALAARHSYIRRALRSPGGAEVR